MPSVFLVSDTHFGHEGVCRFMKADGVTKLRPWDNADEMDEALIENWNNTERLRVPRPDEICDRLGGPH